MRRREFEFPFPSSSTVRRGGKRATRRRSPPLAGEGVDPRLLRLLRRRREVGVPSLCVWRVDRVGLGSGRDELGKTRPRRWRNKDAFLPLSGRRRRVVGGFGPPAFGSCVLGSPGSSDLWSCCFPSVGGGATPPSAYGRVPVPPLSCRRAVVSSICGFGRVRSCAGGADGGPGSGGWFVLVVVGCGELGVSRRPRFGSTAISTSLEVVTDAALNACGLGAPATPCREVEDGGALVCCWLCSYVCVRCLYCSLHFLTS